MKKYCIFRVYDYKGGELRSDTNLTREDCAGNLAELFEGLDIDNLQERRDKKIKKVLDEDTDHLSGIKDLILKEISRKGFFSTYGSYDGFCGKIYEVDNNNLTQVTFESFVDDIVQYIDKHWS